MMDKEIQSTMASAALHNGGEGTPDDEKGEFEAKLHGFAGEIQGGDIEAI